MFFYFRTGVLLRLFPRVESLLLWVGLELPPILVEIHQLRLDSLLDSLEPVLAESHPGLTQSLLLSPILSKDVCLQQFHSLLNPLLLLSDDADVVVQGSLLDSAGAGVAGVCSLVASRVLVQVVDGFELPVEPEVKGLGLDVRVCELGTDLTGCHETLQISEDNLGSLEVLGGWVATVILLVE